MYAFTLSRPQVFAVAGLGAPKRRPRIEPTESDGELVRRTRGGNRWAEEALYERHVRVVTRVVLRLLARTADAEDAVQDAFVIAFSDLEKLRNEEAFGGWLMRIAVHQAHRRLRRRKFLHAVGLDRGQDDVTLAEQVDPRAGPEMRAELAEIDRILAHLPPKARIAWILRHVEGQELRDVAAACECSLATAKRLVRRAEDAIRVHTGLETDGAQDE